MTSQKQVEISCGPSKFDLMVSLFDSSPWNVRKAVIFSIDSGYVTASPKGKGAKILDDVEIKIHAIEREDGSGESWIFKGYLKFKNRPLRKEVSKKWKKVEGYYSSKNRNGYIKIEL